MDNLAFREEADSIGNLLVPVEAYYGIRSLRAKQNFNITGKTIHKELIIALAKLKKSCALTNNASGRMSSEITDAIVKACDEIIEGKWQNEFIVDAIQGGAGTSANMNANEVIANRAIELLGGKKGDYKIVHPNDHVNMSQSTNDIYPSAGKLALVSLLKPLYKELDRLYQSLMNKAKEFDGILKMGRTQLQDAVPMRLGQSFHAFATAIKRDTLNLGRAEEDIHNLNMGASAIGSAITVDGYYLDNIVSTISEVCGEKYEQVDDLFDGTSNIEVYVKLSGALKTLAVTLSKMCNDLRLMSSGPKTGLNEINLPARQNGSSIMPGKVNPVIPEVVSQVAYKVFGNDVTVNFSAEAGQLELNAFEPVIFYSLFESIECLKNAIITLIDNCIDGITANPNRCNDLLEHSVGMATALTPFIGYIEAAKLAKEALKTGVPLRQLVLERGLMDKEKLEEVMSPFEVTEPHHFKKNI